jgi:hypothetical protein
MSSRTKAEKDIKIKFDISTVEREMLEELKDVCLREGIAEETLHLFWGGGELKYTGTFGLPP